ncbi:hypothetical protein GJ496_000191, partial [Pomphorhynchus laevis]
ALGLLYVNLLGSDGDRMIFDGGSMYIHKGSVCKLGKMFTLDDTDICLVDVQCNGTQNSIDVSTTITIPLYNSVKIDTDYTNSIEHVLFDDHELNAAACWLWDHLRRSGASGFFLPLSGGIDSGCVAGIVYHMCSMIFEHEESLKYLTQSIIKTESRLRTKEELCHHMLNTAYLSTQYNTEDSKMRSACLSREINSNHFSYALDTIIETILSAFKFATGFLPKFSRSDSCSNTALENLQARTRMVISYLFAQLVPLIQNKPGFLLMLGTGNADEIVTGYFTKYDCSSADLNPIGGMSKNTVRRICHVLMNKYDLKCMKSIISATPSAELKPVFNSEDQQSDEHDLGLSYDQIETMSKLRLDKRLGPREMEKHMDRNVARKFYDKYRRNRHKTTVATPSMICESSAGDDCRSDFRPFTYPPVSFA